MNDRSKNRLYILCYIAYASVYIARLNLSVSTPLLRDTGILTTAEIGYLGTAFSVVYAFGRLINGVKADSVQPKVMISIGLILCFLANIGMGLFTPFAGMFLFWCANAYAQSMLWSSVLRFVNFIYRDDENKLTRLSMMVSSVASGSVAGILLCTLIVEKMNLRAVFFIPGCITLITGALVFFFLPNVTENNNSTEEQKRITDVFRRLIQLLNKCEIRSAVFPAMLHGIIKDNVTLWMVVYYSDTFGIDLSKIAGYVLFVPIIGFAARIVYPYVLKKCGSNEHFVSILSFCGCAVCSLLIVFSKDPLLSVVCLSLIYSLMSLVNSSMLSIFPVRFEEEGCSASVSGIMDFCTYLGNGIGSLFFGMMITRLGFSSMFISWIIVSIVAVPALYRLSGKKASA